MRSRTLATGVLLSVALTAVSLLTLWPDLGAVIPGPAGDNLAFVWNTWWVGHAARATQTPLWTPMLFVPVGASLALHTHTLLPSLLAAFVSPSSIVLGTNLVVALHLFLNGVTTFALARRVTGHARGAAVAAIAFAWSPYVGAHLAGHFNLIAAWVLPLFALCLLRALDDGRRRDVFALGLVAACLPYVDYYYSVYAVVLAALVVAHRAVTLTVEPRALARWQRRALAVTMSLLSIDLLVLAWVAVNGGGALRWNGLNVSVRGVENPAAIAGLLVMLTAGVLWLPRMQARVDASAAASSLRRLVVPVAIALAIAAPLLIAGATLWRDGGYVTQTYFWRSAPAGVDAGSLLLGNPAGALWAGYPTDAYRRLGIDAIERVAWFGPGLLGLCAAAIGLARRDARVTLWLAIGLAFFVWALGPRLQAFGQDLHVFLPGVLVRYVPLVSNARMPGRAIVVVYLAAAMLAAIGLETLLSRGRRPLAVMLAAILVLDFLPKSPATFRPDRPAGYDVLASQRGAGSLCELPLGLRDGFGEMGRLDMRVMYYQTIHERPITGGFVARLDPRIVLGYVTDPVLGVFLRLSTGAPLASLQTLPAAAAGESLRARGIRFVMLNRQTAPADLARYVETGLPLRVLDEDATRTLYELAMPINASAEPPSR